MGSAGGSTSTVEISISFRSDPLCVIFHRPGGSKNWVQLLRTETIENDLDPDFVTKLIMDYKFEQQQDLRFHVYDVDSDSLDLESHESLGYADVTLGKIVMAGESGFVMELSGLSYNEYDRPNSTILLIAEELVSEKEEVTLKLSGSSIGKWSGPLPPKTFFAVSKMTKSEKYKYLVVHRSPPCRGSKPTWAPLKMSSRSLCNGDYERILKIEIIQILFSEVFTSLGFVLLTLNQLKAMSNKENINLTTNSGHEIKSSIKIVSCTLVPVHTFIEYIRATQIHCCFSIDFSCSNGDPHEPVSLHYYGKAGSDTVEPNVYEQAIQSVGNVLQDYDNTGNYPVWGFGARLPPDGDLRYDFPITLTQDPNCGSISGVLETYRVCLPQLQLYGPTYFAPIIKIVAAKASKGPPGENYYILVIITDGVITDIEETKKVIVEASELPMSIVIIGVGEADFDTMEELDGDAVRISFKRKVARRDIVQFVAYRSARLWMWATGESTMEKEKEKFSYDIPDETKKSEPPKLSQAEIEARRMNRLKDSKLAQEILAEIPDQLVSYMRMKNLTPSMVKRPGAFNLATKVVQINKYAKKWRNSIRDKPKPNPDKIEGDKSAPQEVPEEE